MGESRKKRKPSVLVTLGWYDPRFFEAIGRYARQAGWHLATRSMMEASATTGWRGDGLLVNDTEVPRLSKFIRTQARKQPTVLFGANHRGINSPSVEEDNRACGHLAAEHFLQRGYQHFCWVGISRGRVERDRRAGFVDALSVAGHGCTELALGVTRGEPSDTWNNRRRWLQRGLAKLPKPVAIFAIDDLLAADVIETALDSGDRVPEDIAVMGAGNIELACDCSPVPISSIDLNFNQIAYRAAELLNHLMDGGEAPSEPIVVPVQKVVTRASTDTIAVGHPAIERAVALIQSEFGRDLGVADIARAAGVSRRMLHYLFANELHRTPASFLRQVRLDHAKRMLEETDEKIATIAGESGFATSRNLHRTFVRETGVAPQHWRTNTPT